MNPPPSSTVTQKAGWTLTFDDEFSGTSLDTTKWNLADAATNGGDCSKANSNESECYMGSQTVAGSGLLTLKATKGLSNPGNELYGAGKVDTKGKFYQAYGYFEMRAQMPAGQIYWPAFWLLRNGGGWPPEIDIFEGQSSVPMTDFTTTHWQDPNTYLGNPNPVADTTADFHTYGVDYTPSFIHYYFDGKMIYGQTASQVGIPSDPMYMILNVAIGGWANTGDPASGSNPAVVSMKVDWVRVYQRIDQGQTSLTPPDAI
jgi:beta-glucanase (GH16 family)